MPPRPGGQTDSATLTATSSNPSATASLTLTGKGHGPALAWLLGGTAITFYDYGTLKLGQKISQTFTLANSGNQATSPLVITLTGSRAFTKSNGCNSVTLAPGKLCSITVTYAPTRRQADSATLTATSRRVTATASLTLTGNAKASPVIATHPSKGGPVGSTTVSDIATLSGGNPPRGTIEFKLYGPSAAADCSGTPVFDKTAIVSHGQSFSPSFTPAQAGTYWWTASYSGDTANNPAATNCGDEQVAIGKATPAISTSPSADGPVGTTVIDTATLSGGSSPGGTIEFKLYGPSAAADCSGTPLDDETVTISGDGSYTTPTGATPSQAGTYWWIASYSGDANDNPAATNCGDEQVAIGKATPAISTSPSADGPVGTTVIDTATLSGGSSPGGTIEFKLYGPSAAADCSGTPLDDETVTISGNGSYTTPAGFTPAQPGTYWWIASYSGDANDNPAATNCGDEQATITASAHIYWTLFGGGTVMEANLDGSNPQPIVTGQNSPYGVAVDSSHIYWTNEFGGTVMEANLDGTGVTTLVSGQGSPEGVAVGNGHIYWTLFGGTVMEANLDGTGVTTLVSGQNYTDLVAVDSSHIYWSDHIDGTIMGANLDGTGVTTLVSGQASPYGVAVDSGHIYWADYDNAAGGGTIMEANLDGTGVTTLVSGQDFPYGLAVGNGHIYWSSYIDGTVMEANLDGTGVQTLVSGQGSYGIPGVAVGP